MSMQAAPPCILALIPWGPSPPHHHEEAFDLNPHIWSHLPEDLLHLVLERLPFENVLRFRCVCKQWKALFASPAFYHFASHRAHVPPLIFFLGSSTSLDDNENSDAFNHYDDGYDDNGYVYEDDKGYDPDDDGSDEDGNDGSDEDDKGYADHGDSQCDDHSMGHGDIHDVLRYANNADVLRCEDMHDVMRYGDYGDIFDVMRYDDPWDMQDAIGHGVIHDVDGHANDQEAPEEHTNIEPLLLIYDCESETWRRPLAVPPGFRVISHRSFLHGFHVCNFQEQVLIPTSSPDRLFLFNPASPPCKELPPCIAIQDLEAFGFLQERTTLPCAASPNLRNLFSLLNEKQPHVQDRTAKNVQVVAVGNTVNDTHIVESFNSVTGSWHVIGRLPPESDDEFIFDQRRMIYCKGCFYALLSNGILMMSDVLEGQNMEWNFREFPDPPNCQYTELIERRLTATEESVFLVGVTSTSFPDTYEQWDFLIWQFHPRAPADACWELHAYLPRRIWNTFIGDTPFETINCLAHGDLIFVTVRGRRRFLIYDVPQKLWRFSAKCKYILDLMTFVWEPLVRN